MALPQSCCCPADNRKTKLIVIFAESNYHLCFSVCPFPCLINTESFLYTLIFSLIGACLYIIIITHAFVFCYRFQPLSFLLKNREKFSEAPLRPAEDAPATISPPSREPTSTPGAPRARRRRRWPGTSRCPWPTRPRWPSPTRTSPPPEVWALNSIRHSLTDSSSSIRTDTATTAEGTLLPNNTQTRTYYVLKTVRGRGEATQTTSTTISWTFNRRPTANWRHDDEGEGGEWRAAATKQYFFHNSSSSALNLKKEWVRC